MTEQPASQQQPSMDDILASIRRIMDDGETGSAPVSALSSAATPERRDPQPPRSYDHHPDPEEETIFPERSGLLWRRVAGRTLEAQQPAADDDAYDLTEALDDSETDEYELNELLDEAAGIDSDDRALEAVAEAAGDPGDGPDPAESLAASLANAERLARQSAHAAMPPPLPTDAGPASLGIAGTAMMDRVAERVEAAGDDDDDGEILDLIRPVGDETPVEEIVSAMAGEASDPGNAPEPDYESIRHEEAAFFRDHDPVTVTDPEPEPDPYDQAEDSYETALRPNSGYAAPSEDDARERALDARFYDDAASYDDEVPDVEGDYAAAFTGETGHAPNGPGAPQDELDTVGGLVRDALRSRNPAIVGNDPTALVSRSTEESASRALATLSRAGTPATRRVYGELRITDEEDAPTIDAVVRDELRPMLREWLNDNLPTVVEGMVRQEVERISARSRRFVRSDDD